MLLNRGRIRPMMRNDLDRVLSWRNSERISRSMFSDHKITVEEHYNWFKGLKAEKDRYFVFELDGQPVGLVYFNGIDSHNSKCSWGFYIGENNQPRGTGLLLGYKGLEWVFNELEIRKLNSQSFAYNIASINYHKKLGFVEEGLLKSELMKDSHYEDVLVLALFAESWREHCCKVEKAIKGYEGAL